MNSINIKILTDIKIIQSDYWTSKTNYIGDMRLFNIKRFENILSYLLPNYILNSLKLIINIKRYEVVITANIRTTQIVGILRRIFRIKNIKHIALEVMLDEEKNNIKCLIKKYLQKYFLAYLDIIFVSSSKEVEIYSERLGFPKERIIFLPFHTNVIEPKYVQGKGEYLLSCGKTHRDFKILADIIENIDAELYIISDRENIRGINFPENVKIFLDISYDMYLKLLENSRIVIIPLKNVVKSSGQAVILEAMAMGKPVIATRTNGTIDYIKHGINGILVNIDDRLDLSNAIISLLNEPLYCEYLGFNALETVVQKHSFDTYTKSIINMATIICKKWM